MRAFVFEFWIVTFIKFLFDKEVIVEIDGTLAIERDSGPSRCFSLVWIGAMTYL